MNKQLQDMAAAQEVMQRRLAAQENQRQRQAVEGPYKYNPDPVGAGAGVTHAEGATGAGAGAGSGRGGHGDGDGDGYGYGNGRMKGGFGDKIRRKGGKGSLKELSKYEPRQVAHKGPSAKCLYIAIACLAAVVVVLTVATVVLGISNGKPSHLLLARVCHVREWNGMGLLMAYCGPVFVFFGALCVSVCFVWQPTILVARHLPASGCPATKL